MQTVVIVIHLMVVVALVGVVLLQRSEGGALGIGGGSGFMTARGAANALTRATAILAAAFFVTSLGLSVMARYGSHPIDILEQCAGGKRQPAGRRRRARPTRRPAADAAGPAEPGTVRAFGRRDLDDDGAFRALGTGTSTPMTPSVPSGEGTAPETPATPAQPAVPNQ